MSSLTALALYEISVTFGERAVLRDVSFGVPPGETVGVIGPNGSGKTTLFNAVSGFVTPTQGRIELLDQEITRLHPHERARRGIGRVFQSSGVFQDMTVIDNVLVALEVDLSPFEKVIPWGKGVRDRRERAMEILAEVGLADSADLLAGSLSGGQQRLLEIQRVLARGAEVLLLDEPTAGVSPKMKDDVAHMIERVKARGKTTLIIEHDMSFIYDFCDRLLLLEGGSVLLDGSPDFVRKSPVLEEVYLGKRREGISPAA